MLPSELNHEVCMMPKKLVSVLVDVDFQTMEQYIENIQKFGLVDSQLNALIAELINVQQFPQSKMIDQFHQQLRDELFLQSRRNPKLDRSVSEPIGGGISESSLKKSTNLVRYKTELCRQYEEYGQCRYGNKCQFAHGDEERRSLVRHPKYKTEMCRTFHMAGFCPYGLRCHFIHNEEERRSSDYPHTPNSLIASSPLFLSQYSADFSPTYGASSSSSSSVGIMGLPSVPEIPSSAMYSCSGRSNMESPPPLPSSLSPPLTSPIDSPTSNGVDFMEFTNYHQMTPSFSLQPSFLPASEYRSKGRPILSRSVSAFTQHGTSLHTSVPLDSMLTKLLNDENLP